VVWRIDFPQLARVHTCEACAYENELPTREVGLLKVLVVDDSPAIQRSLGRLLSSIVGIDVAGYADDVPGALSLIDSVRPDVVVLDVNLLDGDRGIDVLHYLNRQRPLTKIVTLSNTASQKLRESYLEAGAAAYFDKATQFMQCRDWIAALLPRTPEDDGFGGDLTPKGSPP
jgi:DNA-binding NarL/FixJ family response regulator